MRKVLAFVVFILTTGALTSLALAQDEPVAFDGRKARVYKAERGQALTAPSKGGPASIVANFLHGRGTSEAAVRSLQVVSHSQPDRAGITQLRMEQQVAGLRVVDAYVKAALDGRGALLHVVENLASVPARSLAAARADEEEALRAALGSLYPGLNEDLAPVGRQGNTTTFGKGRFFYTGPSVERVAIAMTSGVLKAGFLVETWSDRGNLLHETLVAGNGRVLAVEQRTNTDRYNIFPVHPDATPQTVVRGPGDGNTESPAGWLSASGQTSVDIAGNNAHAYLDVDADNASDGGGEPVTNGRFLSDADLTVSPSTPTNRNVAVQNLFYLNNVIHDTLFRHGFTETTGNFQEDNFGQGGRDSDSVNAEAQDGSGTDNANFATPGDGKNPRMQMFLWTGKGNHQVVVHSPAGIAGTYRAQGAAFGPALNPTGITGDVALADDGTAPTSDACQALPAGSLSGRIALIDRGTCTFVFKVKNAQNAGAIAAIVANHLGDSIFTMGGADATITIPSVFISRTDGNTIKSGLAGGVNATVRLTDPPPLQRDGDVDSDIVWHEYGHGLTWRMIGKMSGPLSGAIGEGMSDVLAILINNDDVVAEYSFDDPIGIRSAPYTNYGRTYGDVAGSGVHFDGEVYAAIGWRLGENFQAAGLSRETLLDYIVDGMNYTPAGPAFEDMRDGILQSVANAGGTHECLVWDAFADYGVGVGARATTRGASVIVAESFTLPAQCQ